MYKQLKLALYGIIVSFLVAFCMKNNAIADDSTYGTDKDGDGILVYSELNDEARANVDAGYGIDHSGGGLGYEMIYMLSNPLITNVGTSHNGSTYHGQAIRTKRYYRLLRTDKSIYPENPHTWYVTSYWEDESSETGWSAAVTNTAPNVELKTPATIFADGHTCVVKVLDLKNAYVKRLTVTDNIEEIRHCQTPMLKHFSGGYNVKKIGAEAFKDNIYMANLPYFPFLTYVGSKAFEGCFNLKDVLLPPMIETLYWDAFGWYEVVKGGYSQNSFQYDDEYSNYSLLDEYAKKDKIYGITLYATEETTTYNTLKDLLDYAPLNSAHLSYKTSDKYPGLANEVEIPDDELSEWLPPLVDPSTLEWDQERRAVDPKDTVAVQNSVTSDQAEVVDYLVMLRLQGKISDDMVVALLGAIVGDNDVPRQFLEENCKDPEAIRLMHLYVANANKNMELRHYINAHQASQAQMQQDFLNKRKNDEQLKNLVYYFSNTFSIVAPKLIEMGQLSTGVVGDIFTTMDNFNNFCDALARGESIQNAGVKFLTTTGYLMTVSQLAPSPVSLYESVVFVLLGNSKAADSLSIVTTGRHIVELSTDIAYGAVVDAWDGAKTMEFEQQWITFFTLFYENVCKIAHDMTDISNNGYRYGQTITNISYLASSITDPVIAREAFFGYMDLISSAKGWKAMYSTFSDTMYDLSIDGNYMGMVLYDFVKTHYTLSETERLENFYKYDMNNGARNY